jgi:hypothetical protein
LTQIAALSRIGEIMGTESAVVRVRLVALAVLLLAAAPASAGDPQALAQGFKDEDACNQPYAETLDAKAFLGCLNALDKNYKGKAASKQSYIVGVGFNAWSLANIVAASQDKDLFPDIAVRTKASKQRQLAMRLFDVFRPAQKAQKIADADLAKLAGADLTGLKPVLDYYDGLPKK